MKEKVIVTGAGGYIGRKVVDKLLEIGKEVIAIDINIDNINPLAQIIKIDFFSEMNENLLQELLKADRCLHLAWRDGFVHNSDKHMEDLPKHYKFLKSLIENGMKKISILGTMHEIGYWHGEIDEETPTNPFSLYGISKNTLRQALEILAKEKKVELHWLRAFYILGDDRYSNSLFAKILKMEEEEKEKFPFTTGENKYDFISIDELSNQIVKASIQDEITGIINVCSGKSISLKERVEKFLIENNLKIRPEYGVYPNREYDSPAVWGNNSKISKIMSK